MNTTEKLAKALSAKPPEALVAIIGATVELIASIRATPEVTNAIIGSGTRGAIIDGLRQLGRCAFQLAEDLDALEKKRKRGQ